MDGSPTEGSLKDPGSPICGSEGDFDDDLGVPDSLTVVDVDGTPTPVVDDNGNPYKFQYLPKIIVFHLTYVVEVREMILTSY